MNTLLLKMPWAAHIYACPHSLEPLFDSPREESLEGLLAIAAV